VDGCNISSRLSVLCGETVTCLLRLQDVRSPATRVACHDRYSAISMFVQLKTGTAAWFLQTSNYARPTTYCGVVASFAYRSNPYWSTILIFSSGFNRIHSSSCSKHATLRKV